jgi:hypothetical protein
MCPGAFFFPLYSFSFSFSFVRLPASLEISGPFLTKNFHAKQEA